MDPAIQRSAMASQAAAMVVVMVAFLFSRVKRRRGEDEPIVYGPRAVADEHRRNNMDLIYNSTDQECIAMLRMSRAPFFAFCNLFRQTGLVLDSINASVEEQVSMFLHVVRHNQRYRVVHQSFRRSIETVHHYFHQVMYAVGELRSEMIKPPGLETHLKIFGSHRWNPYFKDCIGAIDGTHVLARVPRHMQAAFRGRKSNPTQNIMAAVDFDLKFTYVLAGWEGSAHDALILADAIERQDGLPLLVKCYLAALPRMSSVNANAGEGFVTAASLMLGVGMPATAAPAGGAPPAVAVANVQPLPAVGANGVAGAVNAGGAGAGVRPPMRWINNTSGFVLHRMRQLILSGARADKGFKEKDINQVAKALREYFGEEVTATQVYNHLRKWRQRWGRVCKLKDLNGALWDDDTKTIMLDQDHDAGHVKDHPKDAEYLNTPIRFYEEMETIFGSTSSTGRFAVGSNEPLGVASNTTDTAAGKMEGTFGHQQLGDEKPDHGESSKATEATSVGGKRKRPYFSEEEMLLMTNMTDAVNNVANALKETSPAHVDADLYHTVVDMPGFTEDAPIVAFSHLLDNKVRGKGFVDMVDSHRVIWLRNFLAKHYYI